MSDGLYSDQARRSVGPDLGPNCLQKFSADDIVGKELIRSHLHNTASECRKESQNYSAKQHN